MLSYDDLYVKENVLTYLPSIFQKNCVLDIPTAVHNCAMSVVAIIQLEIQLIMLEFR